MPSKKMIKALNEQITKELYSAYLYLQMGAWFEDASLPGMANWMKIQAQEESAHAMIFFNYVCETGGFVELGAIDKPICKFDSPKAVFEEVLAHEKKVTKSINDLMALAMKENDFASRNRLEWFIAEQVEEESNANDILGKLKLIGDKGQGIFMIDRELGARVFTPPAELAAE